jgi:hypothetical protein
MKKLIFTKVKFSGMILILVMLSSVLLYAFSSGETGRTQKTSTQGCGSCHGNNPVNEVMVTVLGPDTVVPGQTTLFFLTITKLSKTGAGLDVAARSGSLSPVSNSIHLSGDELTHNSNIPMTNGTVTVQFNYTAPNFETLDTLWATGLATNSDGTSSGDNWNWSAPKRVFVRNPIGIRIISSNVPGKFSLEQNYPNPFNPVTQIKFTVPKSDFVRLAVFDLTGSLVETLVQENLSAGTYNIEWDGSRFSSGVYFYRLQSGNFAETRKMMLTK